MEAQYPYDGRQSCKDQDPDLFFPEDYSSRTQIRAAKAVCNQCPLLNPCLEYAVTQTDLDGIWGATTPRERQRIRSSRRLRVKVYS